MKARTTLALIAAIPLLMGASSSGCAEAAKDADKAAKVLDDQDGVVIVRAPSGKCWSGAIGDSTKQGCGTKRFPITGESIISANAQKETPGTWRMTVVLKVGGQQVDASATTAEYGIAQVLEK